MSTRHERTRPEPDDQVPDVVQAVPVEGDRAAEPSGTSQAPPRTRDDRRARKAPPHREHGPRARSTRPVKRRWTNPAAVGSPTSTSVWWRAAACSSPDLKEELAGLALLQGVPSESRSGSRRLSRRLARGTVPRHPGGDVRPAGRGTASVRGAPSARPAGAEPTRRRHRRGPSRGQHFHVLRYAAGIGSRACPVAPPAPIPVPASSDPREHLCEQHGHDRDGDRDDRDDVRDRAVPRDC